MKDKVRYDRAVALEYAKKWALLRNPGYMDFERIGGDCTNFVSQCIFAGCNAMNFTPIYGWYYKNNYDRAPSWSDVDFFYNFLVNNKGAGPTAIDVDRPDVLPADVVQLSDKEGNFHHSCLVLEAGQNELYLAAHSTDSYMRPLSTYEFANLRFLHVLGGEG